MIKYSESIWAYEAGLRPDSITIKLYRYKDGESYDPDSPFMTGTASEGTSWKYEFVLQDDEDGNAVVYNEGGEYKTYKFAVEEVPVQETY